MTQWSGLNVTVDGEYEHCSAFWHRRQQTELFVYPVHWIDPLISFFRLSVCGVFVNRSVVERLRPHFFTDFHEILHAAQKCGRLIAYCL